MTHQEGIS